MDRIPNIPFFYLVYRAWSHWRAVTGGKHIQFLLNNSLLQLAPSKTLDEIYRPPKLPLDGQDADKEPDEHTHDGEPEVMLMSHERRKDVSEKLDLPELEAELDRAVWQVERDVANKMREEKERAGERAGKKDQ